MACVYGPRFTRGGRGGLVAVTTKGNENNAILVWSKQDQYWPCPNVFPGRKLSTESHVSTAALVEYLTNGQL